MNTETLLREHFETAAGHVEIGARSLEKITVRVHRTRWVWGAAVAAVLVVSVAAVGLVRGGQETIISPERAVSAGPFAAEIMDLFPAGFDPSTAIPVFAAAGDAETVAKAYLTERFPAAQSQGLVLLSTEEVGDNYYAARWAWGQASGNPVTQDEGHFAGWALLRTESNGSKVVVAATTDGIDLSDLRYVAGVVSGTAESILFETFALDILDLDGQPVSVSPDPLGIADPGFPLGTAGMATAATAEGVSSISFAVGPLDETIVVRVRLVGGSVLSISELAVRSADELVTEAMDLLLSETIPVFDDGSLVASMRMGPELAFETDHLGEEVVLETSVSWDDYTPMDVFPLDPDQIQRIPAAYVGTGSVRMVLWEGDDPALEMAGLLCFSELHYGGGGCWTPADTLSPLIWDYQETRDGLGDGPSYFFFGALNPETAVVALDLGDAGTVWQRPIGGTSVFPVEGYLRADSVTLTLYDSEGRVFNELAIRPPA